MRQVRYVIIGCGMIAKYHVAAIENCTEAQAVGVYGTDPTRTGEFAKQHGLAVYPEAADIWADGDVDAVCICTPSGFHAAYALEAIEHGKHVLIEKPMASPIATAFCARRRKSMFWSASSASFAFLLPSCR